MAIAVSSRGDFTSGAHVGAWDGPAPGRAGFVGGLMRLMRLAIAAVVATLAVTAASAQNGGMKVRVYDKKDNSPVIGAVVELSHATGNIKATTEQTDLDGHGDALGRGR